MRKSLTEVPASSKCPCESGQQYRRCCQPRGITWEVDVAGEFHESRQLGPEAMELLKGLDEEFVATFGRKPGKGDRLFQLSERFMTRATLRAMRAAEIQPPLIYVYIKTGLVVRDPKKLTGRDQQLWNAAINEYYEIFERIGEFDPDPEGALEDQLSEQLKCNHTVGGSFINGHYNQFRKRPGASREVETVAGFMVSNFVRGLLSITVLVNGEAAYDAYAICRSMLENYLALAYVYRCAEVKPFTAQLGVLLGTHRYEVNRRGQEMQSLIVEIATGERVAMPSRWGMAQALGEPHEQLYTTLYRSLSSICHPDMTGIQTILSDEGFDFLNPISSIDVLSVAHFLCVLMFSLLYEASPCTKVAKRDMRTAASRSFFELSLLRLRVSPAHNLAFPSVFAAFMDDLSARDPHFRALAEMVAKASGDQ